MKDAGHDPCWSFDCQSYWDGEFLGILIAPNNVGDGNRVGLVHSGSFIELLWDQKEEERPKNSQ